MFFCPLRVAVIPTPCLVWQPVHHSKTNADWRTVDYNGLEWAKAKHEEYFPTWSLAIDFVFETISSKAPLHVDTRDVNVEVAMPGM